MCMLSVAGPIEEIHNVSRLGLNLVHYAVGIRHVPFLKAVLKRGVDFDTRKCHEPNAPGLRYQVLPRADGALPARVIQGAGTGGAGGAA
jgi:hypothetical protein